MCDCATPGCWEVIHRLSAAGTLRVAGAERSEAPVFGSSDQPWRRPDAIGTPSQSPRRRRRFNAEKKLSAISRRPKSEHRLAFWRTRWRSSAHAGVLAHRLASSAAGKIHRRDAEHAENREIEVEERGLVAINYRSEKRRSFFLPTADSLFLRGPLRPSAVNLRLLLGRVSLPNHRE